MNLDHKLLPHRKFREHHSPQTTLKANCLGVFMRCTQIADPRNLGLIYKNSVSKKKPLPDDVKELLIIPPDHPEAVAVPQGATAAVAEPANAGGDNDAQDDSEATESEDEYMTTDDDDDPY